MKESYWPVFARSLMVFVACFSGACASFKNGASLATINRPAAKAEVEPEWTIDRSAYDQMVPGEGRIHISLSTQRLSLLDAAGAVVIETDCSTGVDGKETPSGRFEILEKIQDKRSNLYGSYVSETTGEVLEPRSWVVPQPEGSRFRGTQMPFWMRLTWTGVGIHVGAFHQGLRTSMGCIRMPGEVQPLLYAKSTIGMEVVIERS